MIVNFRCDNVLLGFACSCILLLFPSAQEQETVRGKDNEAQGRVPEQKDVFEVLWAWLSGCFARAEPHILKALKK
jgi:hypothetical protein